jgi:hypothetical protein
VIPANTYPPSDQLTKLKLFLEKTKTEFTSDNSDLLDWMNDRKLFVDHLTIKKESNEPILDSVETELLKQINNVNSKDNLASSISKEEYYSIMDKITQLLQLPAGQLHEDSELYLEQQLSDLLGFDVTAILNEQRLLFSTGIMKSVSHLKRSPTDTLNKHSNFHEAGISKNRSAFGWFTNSSELTDLEINQEKYYISTPLHYLPNWSSHYTDMKKWYKFRKAIVINPVERIAVVCSIGDIGPSTYTRQQFGGSPELIHTGKIWSPKSSGKVLVLFVDDPDNSVSLGPIEFDKLFKEI